MANQTGTSAAPQEGKGELNMKTTQLGTLFLALLGGACTAPDVETSDSVTEEALSASYGGQTTANEAPQFADPALATTPMSGDDPNANDPMTGILPDGAQRIRVLVVWGYVKPHPDATEVVDWSGSITVANGALRVARTVRFEPVTDTIIRPRTDIHTVAFTSKTKPAADGLLLEVFTGPKLNPSGGAVTLTFSSAPITSTQTLVAGERLSTSIPVDDAGHVLVFHVVRPDDSACREGFMRGQWLVKANLPDGELGVLRGRIGGGDGALEGNLKGLFGKRKDGHSLFFAKVVDGSGAFKALIAGTYADGVLKGRILVGNEGTAVKDLTIDGRVHGHYFDKDMTATDGNGGFVGRWSQKCGEDPNEGQPMSSDDMAPGEDGDASST
jgi:hypothetical protein